MRKLLFGLLTILFVSSLLSCTQELGCGQDISPKQTDVLIEVTAWDLYDAYQENEIAADALYDGKVLKVTGVIDDIGKDFLDIPYIVLTDGGLFTLGGVQCYFNEQHEPELALLNKGEIVTVIGECDGYLFYVSLNDCVLVSQS